MSGDDLNRRAFLSTIVLTIYNSAAGEIGSEKCPPFLELSNLLFELVTRRSKFLYETQWFFF